MGARWSPIYGGVEPVNDMKSDALALAASGWAVFPCVEWGEGAKRPYTRNGFKDATTDADCIEYWWTRRPNAMIGAVVPASLMVLDIDPRHGGSLRQLEARLGSLPPTLTVWSGRNDGGCHLYFLRPPGPLKQSGLPAGVDLRDAGRSYCIVPGSIHPATGQPYRWELNEPMPLPTRAAKLLRPRPLQIVHGDIERASVGSRDVISVLAYLDRFPDHGINAALYIGSCRLAEVGKLNDDAVEALVARAVFHGESESRARATVASAARRFGA